MTFVSGSRRIPRTDRPGSGAYRGPVKEGLAFDDFRAADEHELQAHNEKLGLIARIARRFRFGFAAPHHRPEDILRAAAERLAHDPTVETSRLKITACGQVLLVTGSVTSRWMKKRVSELLHEIPGAEALQNDLLIRPERPRLPQEGALTP